MNPPTPQVKAAMEGRLGSHPDPEGDRLRDAVAHIRALLDTEANDWPESLTEAGRWLEGQDVRGHYAETALRDALAEAGLALHAARTNPAGTKGGVATLYSAQQKFDDASVALCDHRAKAAPEAALCEPPVEFRGEPYHWLTRDDREGCVPVRWMQIANVWLFEGNEHQYKPEEMAAKYYRWHSVASPITITHSPSLPDNRVEPTFVELANFRDIWVRDNGNHLEYTQYLLDALTHFSTPIIPGEREAGVSQSAYESAVSGRQEFRAAFRRERGARKRAVWALESFANPANWSDEPGCLQWTAMLHGIVFADKVLGEVRELLGETLQPAPQNDSIASELGQAKAAEPAGVTDDDLVALITEWNNSQHGKSVVDLLRVTLTRFASEPSLVTDAEIEAEIMRQCEDRSNRTVRVAAHKACRTLLAKHSNNHFSPLNPERQRAIYGGMKRTDDEAYNQALIDAREAGWREGAARGNEVFQKLVRDGFKPPASS